MITFTAVPESGYRVEKWTVTPESSLIAEGRAGNTLAKVKITANTKVNVSFTNDLYTVTLESVDPAKKGAVIKAVSEITGSTLEDATTLVEGVPKVLKENMTEAEADEIIAKITEAGGTASRPERYTVSLTPVEHGTVTANPVIPASGKVDKDTEITFTAASAEGYKVDTWTITPASALQEGGTAGSTTAKVKITAATTVNVSFTKEGYAVTFDAKGGTPVPAAQTVKYKEKASAPSPEPTKEGHTFDGWYNKAGNTLWNFAVNEVTQNTELYAKWRINTYAVTFGTPANGTLKAEVAGTVIVSGKPIEYGKTVTFTAAPAPGYKVDTWTVTPSPALQEGGTPGSPTAKVKITAATTVNVSFTKEGYVVTFDAKGGTPVPAAQTVKYKEKASAPSPEPTKEGHTFDGWYNKAGDSPWNFAVNEVTQNTELYAKWRINTYPVTFGTPANGTLKAELAGIAIVSGNPVEYGKIVTFTAAPEWGYKVDTWTITGGALQEGGTPGSTTAKVKISADINVNVTFTSLYEPVAFGTNGTSLDTYLKTAAPHTDGIYYIKVTGLTPADLKGDGGSFKPGALGKILKDNPTKKVALKLEEIPGLTNMGGCFSGCTSLTQVPEIPNTVTNMTNCFEGCTSLTQAPVIHSVTSMGGCFSGCTSLTHVPGIPYTVTYMRNCFEGCTSLTQAPVIPSGVEGMAGCFKGCTSLTQVPNLPNEVTYMNNCFEGCTSLTQAPKLPYRVYNMKSCFAGCTSLTQAPVIPNGVTYMGDCFSGCTSLTQAPVIPNTVTNMDNCFAGCTSLTQAPEIPNSVTDMSGCFSRCESLTQAPDIPYRVYNMKSCFAGCTSLTQAPWLSSKVDNMESCFAGCTSLTQAPDIPYRVYNMKSCFKDCSELTAITLKCDYVADNFNEAFEGCKKLTAGSIKVPAGQLQTYRNNAGIMGVWSSVFY
ncbi:ribosomal protein L7/L12 [Treponema socranskii]